MLNANIKTPLYYTLTADGTPHPVDVLEWAKAFEGTDRVVRRTRINRILISTVFLGLDHSWGEGAPVLWETMVFGGRTDGDMYRYQSEAAAIHQHEIVTNQIRRRFRKKHLHPLDQAALGVYRSTAINRAASLLA